MLSHNKIPTELNSPIKKAVRFSDDYGDYRTPKEFEVTEIPIRSRNSSPSRK